MASTLRLLIPRAKHRNSPIQRPTYSQLRTSSRRISDTIYQPSQLHLWSLDYRLPWRQGWSLRWRGPLSSMLLMGWGIWLRQGVIRLRIRGSLWRLLGGLWGLVSLVLLGRSCIFSILVLFGASWLSGWGYGSIYWFGERPWGTKWHGRKEYGVRSFHFPLEPKCPHL